MNIFTAAKEVLKKTGWAKRVRTVRGDFSIYKRGSHCIIGALNAVRKGIDLEPLVTCVCKTELFQGPPQTDPYHKTTWNEITPNSPTYKVVVGYNDAPTTTVEDIYKLLDCAANSTKDDPKYQI